MSSQNPTMTLPEVMQPSNPEFGNTEPAQVANLHTQVQELQNSMQKDQKLFEKMREDYTKAMEKLNADYEAAKQDSAKRLENLMTMAGSQAQHHRMDGQGVTTTPPRRDTVGLPAGSSEGLRGTTPEAAALERDIERLQSHSASAFERDLQRIRSLAAAPEAPQDVWQGPGGGDPWSQARGAAGKQVRGEHAEGQPAPVAAAAVPDTGAAAAAVPGPSLGPSAGPEPAREPLQAPPGMAQAGEAPTQGPGVQELHGGPQSPGVPGPTSDIGMSARMARIDRKSVV